MPPRKRKGAGAAAAAAEHAAEEQLPDRDETARKIQEKLEALDRAGECQGVGYRSGLKERVCCIICQACCAAHF